MAFDGLLAQNYTKCLGVYRLYPKLTLFQFLDGTSYVRDVDTFKEGLRVG